jgi:hypothetical protein
MPILIAAVAVVGSLCLLDLLLTFGVIRRLREHTALLTTVAPGEAPAAIGLPAGELPAAFSSVTTDGEPVSGTSGLRVVAFFSSRCSFCPERVPPFADYLNAHRIGRDSVLAISVGSGDAPAPYLSGLAQAAQICVEPEGGDICGAFKVGAFPAFVLLDADGAVAVSGHDPAALPGPAALPEPATV